jgi:dihydroneopterin aldolase
MNNVITTLSITALELHSVIGVHAWEKQIPQKLLLDLEVGLDVAAAASSDDIQQTLDYSALATLLIDYAAETKHALIETLAHQLQQRILEKFPQVQTLLLTLHKPGALPKAKSVSVKINWIKNKI